MNFIRVILDKIRNILKNDENTKRNYLNFQSVVKGGEDPVVFFEKEHLIDYGSYNHIVYAVDEKFLSMLFSS